jgi:hypothetical protein
MASPRYDPQRSLRLRTHDPRRHLVRGEHSQDERIEEEHTKGSCAHDDLALQEQRVDAVRFQRRDFIEPLQENDRSLSDEAIQRCSEHAFETTKTGHLAGHELTEASAPIRIARTNSTKEQRFGYGTDRGGGREAVWRIRCARREDGAVGWEGRGARLIVKSVDDGAGALGERQSLNFFP